MEIIGAPSIAAGCSGGAAAVISLLFGCCTRVIYVPGKPTLPPSSFLPSFLPCLTLEECGNGTAISTSGLKYVSDPFLMTAQLRGLQNMTFLLLQNRTPSLSSVPPIKISIHIFSYFIFYGGHHMKVSPEPGLAIRQWEHLDSKCRGKAPDGCSQAEADPEA